MSVRSIKRILKIEQKPDELYCHWYAARLDQLGIRNVPDDLESFNPRLAEAVLVHYGGIVAAAGVIRREYTPAHDSPRQSHRMHVTSGVSYLYPEGE